MFADDRQARIDLAAAFRLTARFGWHEAVANHFSLALDPDGRRILINPRWRHFARITASELLLLDVDDPECHARGRMRPTRPPGASTVRCIGCGPRCAACCTRTCPMPPR